MIKRVLYFLVVNAAIMLILGTVLALLPMFGIDLGYSNAGGLISALLFGMGGSFISLFMAKWMAKRFMGVKLVEATVRDARMKWVYQTVERQAKEARIKMPEVGLFQNPSPNAFATGSSKNNSMVAVSSGLLQSMNDGEVEAVLAHEIAHIANGDMVTMALIQGVINTFVILLSRVVGMFIDKVIFKNEDGPGIGYFIGYIISSIVLTIMASTITMWFSRKREFKADAGAAYLAGKDKMIAALERLKQSNIVPLPDEMAAFGIAGGKSKLSQLFSSHPPIDDRIAALKKL